MVDSGVLPPLAGSISFLQVVFIGIWFIADMKSARIIYYITTGFMIVSLIPHALTPMLANIGDRSNSTYWIIGIVHLVLIITLIVSIFIPQRTKSIGKKIIMGILCGYCIFSAFFHFGTLPDLEIAEYEYPEYDKSLYSNIEEPYSRLSETMTEYSTY